MRSFIRTFLVLPALILALVAIPVLFLSATGSASGSTHSDVMAFAGALSSNSITAFQSPVTPPPGTVPTATPVWVPTPRPPRPHPVYPTPAPAARSASDKAMIYPNQIEKVIGDQLSPTIYAINSKGALYRSNDNGRVWFMIRSQLAEVDTFIMSSANPDILYSGVGNDCNDPAAENQPFYQSIDGGYTWEELPAAVNLRPLLIDPADSFRLFAADCQMLYLSNDGGLTWMEMPDTSVAQLWSNFRVVNMAAAALVGDPAPEQPHWDQIYAVGVNADGESVIAFSGDQGETWANITDPDKAPEELHMVIAHQTQAGTLWLLAANGVWSSTDFGVNWTFTNRGLTDLPAASTGKLTDMVYAYNGKLYLATSRGLYQKDFDGKAWKKVGSNSFGSEALDSLLLTDSNETVLWVNTADEGAFTYKIEED